MKTILYLHGFAGSGASGTATSMRNALYPEGIQVLAPDMPVSPTEAIAFLHQYTDECAPDLIIGTSMGAMYAEQLRGHLRILVNPSFEMARLLTFRGMGRITFRNKRQDGAKDFKVDKELIAQFREVQKASFQGITPQEKELVHGLFGIHDKTVNCQPLFRKHYGSAHLHLIEAEHYLNDNVLKHSLLPYLRQLSW